MLKALLFFSILQIVRCFCPDGFQLVRDGQCRGSYTTMHMTSSDAYNNIVAKCKEIQGLPIIIHNEEQDSYWTNWRDILGITASWAWPIGLTCNTVSKQWEWADGSALDYKPTTAHSTDLDKECTSSTPGSCWIMNPQWAIFPPPGNSNWTPNILCTKQLPPLPIPNGCDRFENDSDDEICYQIGAEAQNWQDAQMICKSVGADLASIHDVQENSFIRRLAVSKGDVSGVFLGATISGKGNAYGWIDGSAWDYENFHSGFPMAGFGDCIAMDTSTSAGQWMNRDCSTKLPVACIRNKTDITEPTCVAGPWEQNKVITSPGFPYNSSIPCEFFFMVEEGKKVQLEIIALEANTCCDNLVIYDDYLGGNVIANLTGEVTNATYTTSNHFMKVVWAPDGGVNVRGVAMVFRGV